MPGAKVGTSAVWDRLTDGSDLGVSTSSQTGTSSPLPRCLHPYQVTASPSLRKRTSPSATASSPGSIPDGGLAWAWCQANGGTVGSSHAWDRLVDNTSVSDWFVATFSKTRLTAPLQHC